MNGFLQNFRLADLADILLITILIYYGINQIRGTRAVQMVIGLVAVALLFGASQYFELYTLSWLLNNFLASLLLVVVILFQSDIRRALTRVGRGSWFGREREKRNEMIDEISRAAVLLATKRVGALIAVEREVGLSEYLEAGTSIDARVSGELLTSLFLPASPLHDGAVVVREGRIAAASCFLPLTTSPLISRTLGSRHRAAIGLTEETDAVVIVVSEEEGQISLVRDGKITRDMDAGSLRTTLTQLVMP